MTLPDILHQPATRVLFLVALGCGILFYVLARGQVSLNSRRALFGFFALWLLGFTVEFWILGPYSFIAMEVEGNVAAAFNHFLVNFSKGQAFAMSFAGGQDVYAVLNGGQYLNPDALTAQILPIWLALLVHKVTIGTLGFFGTYRLARQVAPGSRVPAAAIAALMPLSHLYLLNYSTVFATGFSAMPIAVYTCILAPHGRRFLLWLLAATLAMGTADPVHVYPAFAVAFVGAAIFYGNVRWGHATLAFGVFVVAAILNWHEIIWALHEVAPYTPRGDLAAMDGMPLDQTVVGALANYVKLQWIPTGVYLVSILFLAASRDRFLTRALLLPIWSIAAYTAAQCFPWEAVGLQILNGLSHGYMHLAWFVLVTPVAARAFHVAASTTSTANGFQHRAHVLMAMAFALMVWTKELHFGQFLWFGGQSTFFGFESLHEPEWRPGEEFRTVTALEQPSPNITAGFYGLETFDGQLNLSLRHWDSYWVAVQKAPVMFEDFTRIGLKWKHWDGSRYAIEDHVHLDLLGIANVRFILSPLPLAGERLTLRHDVDRADWALTRPSFFASTADFVKNRVKRIFDPGDLFVYEIDRVLPRLFAASAVEAVPDDLPAAEFHQRVAGKALDAVAVARAADAGKLGQAHAMTVEGYQRVADGYDASITAPDGGVLVLNVMHLPFWTAAADGVALTVLPVNGVHMAISVPPGAREVRFRYRRPLLRDLAAQRLAGSPDS